MLIVFVFRASRTDMSLSRAYGRITDDEARRCCLVTDPRQADNPIVYATQFFLTYTGYSESEILGRNCRFMQGPETDPADVAAIHKAVSECRGITIDILNYRKDGTPFWNRLRIRATFKDGKPDSFIGVQNPIAEAEVRRGPVWELPRR